MKPFLLSCFILFLSSPSFSQQNDSTHFKWKNNIQLSAGGHGLIYSVNYERFFLNHKRFKTSGEIGFAYYPPKTGIISTWIPLSVNELISFGKHHAEVGVGYILTTHRSKGIEGLKQRFWEPFGSLKIGYRYQKANGRFLYKLAFTPVLDLFNGYGELYPLAGGTVGYNF